MLDYIEHVLFPGSVPPSEVAAILVEPIQGEGGLSRAPGRLPAGLRDLCDRHGILLILDEVQAGVGRTGKMFAGQHWGVAPDIMTLAKGLGSGLPIGAVVAKKRIMEKWTRGAHGNTFGGNPLCCAAALATLDLVEREYAGNAAAVGEHFMARLRELQARHDVIGEVRGKGLMIGMELVKDRTSRAPAKDLCDAVIHRAFHNGLILLVLRGEHRALHAAPPGHEGRRGRGGDAARGEPRGGAGGPPMSVSRPWLRSSSSSPSPSVRRRRPPAPRTASPASRRRRPRASGRSRPTSGPSCPRSEARAWHRHFTAEPHPAGSERNNELARYIAEEWKKQGLEDVVVHRYDVLNTAPREVSLTMVAPVRYEASLREEPYDADPDTKNPRVSPGYLGLSASADVEAPVVYAHSGNPEDYDGPAQQRHRRAGQDRPRSLLEPVQLPWLQGPHRRARGGGGHPHLQRPRGGRGKRGPVFPDGPWGPESHIQRGAITYDFIVPGDPLTPGWPSLPGARQVKPEEARSLPKIAGLPLSWKDAKPLLENMDGPVAPKDWQGGLPIEYRLGGGRVRVKMHVAMDNRVSPNYVVEGRIRGAEWPDEWIVLGNHRDAWAFGGVDPSSGTASMMEMTRALGELPEGGEATAADPRLLFLGRRGGRPDRLDGVGRELRRRPEGEGGRLPQRGLLGLGAGLPAATRSARWRPSSSTSRASSRTRPPAGLSSRRFGRRSPRRERRRATRLLRPTTTSWTSASAAARTTRSS